MSRNKILAIVGCLALCIGGIVAHEEVGHKVESARAMAAAPDAQPSWEMKAQSALSAIATMLGGVGVIIGYLHKFADSLPVPDAGKTAIKEVIDIAAVEFYSAKRNKSTNPVVRASLLTAGKEIHDQNFTLLFPIDPAIDGGAAV